MTQAGESFFEALQELQPDVDLVILPPERPVVAPYADRDEAIASARGTAAVVEALLVEALLVESGIDVLHRSIHERWDRQQDDVHVHVSRARVDHGDSHSGIETLLRVGDVLAGGGWQPESVDSPTPWIVATSPTGQRADVAVEGSQLVITITSAPLRLKDDPQ